MLSRRNIHIGRFRLRWILHWREQEFEFWNLMSEQLWSFSIHWNRLLHPSAWWWFHSNGAVKGRDNCYDFNWNLFIFHFSYTNFALWKYKRR